MGEKKQKKKDAEDRKNNKVGAAPVRKGGTATATPALPQDGA